MPQVYPHHENRKKKHDCLVISAGKTEKQRKPKGQSLRALTALDPLHDEQKQDQKQRIERVHLGDACLKIKRV